MATRRLGAWNDETVVLEIDTTVISSGLERIDTVRMINNSANQVRVIITYLTRVRDRVFDPGTTSISLPTGTNTRFLQRFDSVRTRWDDLSVSVVVPA